MPEAGEWARREQEALKWMAAGVASGAEPQSTLAAMFKERADAEGRLADQWMRLREIGLKMIDREERYLVDAAERLDTSDAAGHSRAVSVLRELMKETEDA